MTKFVEFSTSVYVMYKRGNLIWILCFLIQACAHSQGSRSICGEQSPSCLSVLHARAQEEQSVLHTDEIQNLTHENTRVKVILEKNGKRLVEIRSRQQLVTLGFSFTSHEIAEPLKAVRAQVAAGGSLGKVLKTHGFELRKNFVSVGNLSIGSQLKSAFQTTRETARFQVYETFVRKEGQVYYYGMVAELDSPEVFVNPYGLENTIYLRPTVCEKGVDPIPSWDQLLTSDGPHNRLWMESTERLREMEEWVRNTAAQRLAF